MLIPKTCFTREQFYEKVWSAPATKIAKELGCSDVLIGKECKSHNIPKPSLGYWAKLAHGKKTEKPLLPKDDRPGVQTLIFNEHPTSELSTVDSQPEPVFDSDVQTFLERAQSLPQLQVPMALSRPHLLVQVTRERLNILDKPYYKQTIEEQGDHRPMLDISVSPAARIRALCIFDALIKRIEQIGGEIKIVGERRERRTVVYFAGENVQVLRLRERNRRVRLPHDPKNYFGPETELQPTGVLLFDAGPSYFESVLLSDTPKQQLLETGLRKLVVDLVREAGLKRIRIRQEQEARKRREEEERIQRQKEEKLRKMQEDLERRQQAEQTKVNRLVSDANAWDQSRIVRQYLDAICQVLLRRHGAIPTEGQTAEYLAWARQQVDRMDPLTPSPPSVLDERI